MSLEATGQLNCPVDERSDLYSLGVIYYQILTGRLPFIGNEIGKLLHQQVAAAIAPPVGIDPSIPVELSDITIKLLMKDPDSRYQSARGLLNELDRYLHNERKFTVGGMDRKVKLTYRTRIVVREAEMDRIVTLYDKARQGNGSICLLGGEAGTGKSRLMDEFSSYVGKQATLFIGGRCLNHKNKAPYQPFAMQWMNISENWRKAEFKLLRVKKPGCEK